MVYFKVFKVGDLKNMLNLILKLGHILSPDLRPGNGEPYELFSLRLL